MRCGTKGCVKIKDDLVRRLARFSGEGTPVLVTDQVLAGNTMPVDPESYDKYFQHPKKIEKEIFTSSVSVVGEGVGKIHKYGNYWISETPKPTGPYIITASSPGYISNSSEVEFRREEIEGKIASIKKIGHTDMVLGLPADLMYSSYTSSCYGNGYEDKQLRLSTWDTSFTNLIKPDPETGELILNIIQGDPICREASADNSDALMQPFVQPECNPAISSKFTIFANTTAWHDLGYGANYKSSWPGTKIAEFDYTYGSNREKELVVKTNLSLLDENQLRSIMVWGIAIRQERKINHSYNDYIYFNDMVQNYEDHMNLNQVENALMPGDNPIPIDGYHEIDNTNDTPLQPIANMGLSEYAGIYTPYSEITSENMSISHTDNPSENMNLPLYESLPPAEPAWWDPINFFNTAPMVNYLPPAPVNTNDDMMIMDPVTPEKYKNWYNYLNPTLWFAPDPMPMQMNLYMPAY